MLRNGKKLPQRLVDKLAMGAKITVTVDYSCIDKVQQNDMATLEDWHSKGLVDLQGTEAMMEEFERGSPGVKAKLEEQFSSFAKLKPRTGAVFNHCMFNNATFNEAPTLRNGKGVFDYFTEFQQVMFPQGFRRGGDSYDVMHISIHYLFSRDVFLTRNLHHFSPDKLRKKFKDLVILTPQQFLNLPNDTLGHSQVKS